MNLNDRQDAIDEALKKLDDTRTYEGNKLRTLINECAQSRNPEDVIKHSKALISLQTRILNGDYIKLFDAALDLQQYDLFDQYYERAVEDYSDSADLHIMGACFYVQTGQSQGFRQSVHCALELTPNEEQCDFLQMIAVKIGDGETCLRIADAAEHLHPQSILCKAWAATACLLLEKRTEFEIWVQKTRNAYEEKLQDGEPTDEEHAHFERLNEIASAAEYIQDKPDFPPAFSLN